MLAPKKLIAVDTDEGLVMFQRENCPRKTYRATHSSFVRLLKTVNRVINKNYAPLIALDLFGFKVEW